jgi:hypothetical protein
VVPDYSKGHDSQKSMQQELVIEKPDMDQPTDLKVIWVFFQIHRVEKLIDLCKPKNSNPRVH